ncbi:hypothetical protein LTR28_010148, partial [Elasticomyces elasticus]
MQSLATTYKFRPPAQNDNLSDEALRPKRQVTQAPTQEVPQTAKELDGLGRVPFTSAESNGNQLQPAARRDDDFDVESAGREQEEAMEATIKQCTQRPRAELKSLHTLVNDARFLNVDVKEASKEKELKGMSQADNTCKDIDQRGNTHDPDAPLSASDSKFRPVGSIEEGATWSNGDNAENSNSGKDIFGAHQSINDNIINGGPGLRSRENVEKWPWREPQQGRAPNLQKSKSKEGLGSGQETRRRHFSDVQGGGIESSRMHAQPRPKVTASDYRYPVQDARIKERQRYRKIDGLKPTGTNALSGVVNENGSDPDDDDDGEFNDDNQDNYTGDDDEDTSWVQSSSSSNMQRSNVVDTPETLTPDSSNAVHTGHEMDADFVEPVVPQTVSREQEQQAIRRRKLLERQRQEVSARQLKGLDAFVGPRKPTSAVLVGHK